MTLVVLSSVPHELPHDLNEATLSLCILQLELVSFLLSLGKLLLQFLIFLQRLSKLDFILLDDFASYLVQLG